MSAAVYNLRIEQGADYTLNATWLDTDGNPIDLSGYEVRFQIRDNRLNVLVDFDSTALTDGQTLAPLGPSGVVQWNLSGDVTEALDFDGGRWDMILKSPAGALVRLLQGSVYLEEAVTHD